HDEDKSDHKFHNVGHNAFLLVKIPHQQESQAGRSDHHDAPRNDKRLATIRILNATNQVSRSVSFFRVPSENRTTVGHTIIAMRLPIFLLYGPQDDQN